MAKPNRDRLLLEEKFPEGPAPELGAIYTELVHDPQRVLIQFQTVEGDLLSRVFLSPNDFFQFLQMMLVVGRDLEDLVSQDSNIVPLRATRPEDAEATGESTDQG